MLGYRDQDLLNAGYIIPIDLNEKKKLIIELNTLSIVTQIKAAEAEVKNAETALSSINKLIDEIGINSVNTMYVSGNTTMLHIFFGIAPSSIGVAPYTPVFVDSKEIKGEQIGLNKIEYVISLPCISAFVGADLVAGVNFADPPRENKYNVLVDLGTNAEIILAARKMAVFCKRARKSLRFVENKLYVKPAFLAERCDLLAQSRDFFRFYRSVRIFAHGVALVHCFVNCHNIFLSFL